MFITLEEFKAHARVDFDDDDDNIETLISAASSLVRSYLAESPDDNEVVGDDVKLATMQIAAAWYDNREATSLDLQREIPFGTRDILTNLRGWSFG